jgi:small subunit ribosomal protein S17
MERTNDRKVLTGRVVSDKTDKTIVVTVETKVKHKLYGKRVNYSKKYKAHDENNTAKIGDVVRIRETRPLSKAKRFRLVEVIEEAVII